MHVIHCKCLPLNHRKLSASSKRLYENRRRLRRCDKSAAETNEANKMCTNVCDPLVHTGQIGNPTPSPRKPVFVHCTDSDQVAVYFTIDRLPTKMSRKFDNAKNLQRRCVSVLTLWPVGTECPNGPPGELNHTNERNYVAPADAPPSYSEAMGNSPCRATAPLLETDSTKPSTNDVYPPNQYPQQGPPPVYSLNDPRFADWDDRATNILITNRLRMNDQFNEARNQQERDLLWNVILAQLINDGFTNILLHGMIEYWQFQYYVYQAISNGLTVNHCDNWQYFEPMHNVFGGSGGSGFTSDVLSSGSNLSPSTGTSLDPAGPAVTSNQALEAPSSTLPNQESISVQTLPDTSASSNVTSVVDLPSSAQPLPDVSATGDAVAVSDSLPLLGQSNGDLLPTSSTVAEAANLPTLGSTADVVSASAVTPSLGDTVSGDILQSGDTTNLLSGINFTGTDVATSQPIGESLLPTMLSSDVITSQPTFSSPPLTVGDATDSNGCCAGDGGCCADDGCCGPDGCWATDDCCGDVDCCGSCDCCTGCDACGDCGDCTGADCGDCFVC